MEGNRPNPFRTSKQIWAVPLKKEKQQDGSPQVAIQTGQGATPKQIWAVVLTYSNFHRGN